jgi:flagellar hook-length control protein FliK
MLLTQTAAASPPKTQQARPEPFMAETAAKYERSFLDVLNRQIDMSKNQTYMAADSNELSSNKFNNFQLNLLKFGTTDNISNITINHESFSDKFGINSEPGILETAAKEALNASYKTAETKQPASETGTVEKKSEAADEEKNIGQTDEEKNAKEIEKYLQSVFGEKFSVKVSVKTDGAHDNNGITVEIKGLKENGGKINAKDFLNKIEAILKKQFPQVTLSGFNIEMIKVEAHHALQPSKTGNSLQHSAAGVTGAGAGALKTLEKGGNGRGGGNGENGGGSSSEKENHAFAGISGESSARTGAAQTEGGARAAQKFDQAKMLEQIRAHLNESKFSSSGGTYSLKMVMRPEELGRINLELIMKDGQLSAKFKTDSPASAELLNASVEQLKEMLNEKGIKVVNVEFGNYERDFAGRQSGDQRGYNDQNNRGSGDENNDDAGTLFENNKNAAGRETFEFAQIGGDKNKSIFILNEKTVNVRV